MESWQSNAFDDAAGFLDDAEGFVLDDALREQLARMLAGQFTLNYETQPANPRVSVSSRLLTFSLDGGLTDLERSWLADGGDEKVREFRERVLRAAAEEMGEVVEAILPATKVSHFFTAFDAETRTTRCFFVLDQLEDAEREQREAVYAWGEQARRNARGLRERVERTQKENSSVTERFVALQVGSGGA